MADGKKISRRAFLGGAAGGLFGFLNVQPEDSGSEATKKVAGGVVMGAAIGAATGVLDRAHDKIKPEATPEYRREEQEYAKRKMDDYFRKRLEEKQRDGGSRNP